MKYRYKNLSTEKLYNNGDFKSNIVESFIKNHNEIYESLIKNSKKINKASNILQDTYLNGGRIFFIGAGTSGRLGVMEAAEMPPTFGVESEKFIGLIAGGRKALTVAAEGAEDRGELAIDELNKYNFNKKDFLVGISASGTSDYVLSALRKAKKMKSKNILLSCNKPKVKISDLDIILKVGPEILAGSTRLKSGTITKIALNIITTSAMMMADHSYKGLMIDIKPTTKKLRARCINNLSIILKIEDSLAIKLLEKSKWNIRVAVIMRKLNVDYSKAKKLSKELIFKDILG
ncbi:N-acetylmuramic acid 6-phosphate etherase [bacterium]|nr:N-acetylmuramic acid 6-phosphate etherase [bacterium]MDA9753813.1 N-acetylmuramic acid 6-phosphate etherase [bacterium]NSW96069.1 N-acetylmuramic acid 6-phosphate etherase [bacterium]|tara:strand:+ start:3273 stop:4142 length:870 start_codon:yes stop_codon:yes gene_type:complete